MKRDAIWSGLEATVSGLLSVVGAFVIARITGPAELGIGAAIVAVNVVLWVGVNALFADAIVQRAAIDRSTLSSGFWASTLTGCLAMVIQAGVGPVLAGLLGDPRLRVMALVLAVPLPLVGAAGAIQGLLTRERAYRALALRTLVGQTLGTGTGLAVALAGGGAWAFVCQQAISSGVGALVLLLNRRWAPARQMNLQAVRGLLGVGAPLTASTLVLIGRYRLFAILIGATAGPAVLGQVHLAFRLVDTVRDLVSTALWRLMLPAFAPLQGDPAALLGQVDRWVRRCAAAILPLFAAMALGLSEAVDRLMGPHWAAAGHAAIPLVGLMAWTMLTFPAGVALIAAGQVRFTLYATLASLVLCASGVLLLHPATPDRAIAIWIGGQLLVSPFVLWSNARPLGVGLLRPLTGGLMLSRPAGRPPTDRVEPARQVLSGFD